jgi:hypothetical protein
MPATVSVIQRTGPIGLPVNTAISNLRHNTDDTANPGTVNPLVRPTVGSNYGYWKTTYLNADTTPDGTIDNIRFFSDGTIGWTGVELFAGTDPAYTEATGTLGVTGNISTVAIVDIVNYVFATPLAVPGSLSNPSTGKISDFVVLQAKVGTGAVAGTLPFETLTYRYDET